MTKHTFLNLLQQQINTLEAEMENLKKENTFLQAEKGKK